MKPLHAQFQRLADDSGQALAEYALLIGLVTVVSVAALTQVGQSVNGVFTALQVALNAVPGA